MNRKGFVFLWISAAAFIIAIFVFYGTIGTQTPGGEVLYLGQNEIELFQTYQEGEQNVYYVELAARLSADKSSKNSLDGFKKDFESNFEKYLENVELSIEDYTISYNPSSDKLGIVGISTEDITLSKRNHEYSVKPSFKFATSFEGLEQESVFV